MQLSYEVSEDIYWRVTGGLEGDFYEPRRAADSSHARRTTHAIRDDSRHQTSSTRCSASTRTAGSAPTTRRRRRAPVRANPRPRSRSEQPSHVFLFSHGWKGDVAAARDQYNRWIKAMLDRAGDRGAMPGRSSRCGSACTGRACRSATKSWAATTSTSTTAAMSPDEIVATYLERLGLGRRRRAAASTPSSTPTSTTPPRRSCPPRPRAPTASWPALAGTRPTGPSAPPDADGAPLRSRRWRSTQATPPPCGANFGRRRIHRRHSRAAAPAVLLDDEEAGADRSANRACTSSSPT